jgi:hypothetical protein
LKILLNLQAELQISYKDNLDYACNIGDLKRDLKIANGITWILQTLAIYTPTLPIIKLPYPPKYSGEQKDLWNSISKVLLKLAGENRRFMDKQSRLQYVYGYLKGNIQNQI